MRIHSILIATICLAVGSTSAQGSDPALHGIVVAARPSPVEFLPAPVTVIDVHRPAALPEVQEQEIFSRRSADGLELLPNAFKPVTWTPSEIAYRPLYFDDPMLERHGRSYGHWQPLHSAARFYATFPLLPIKLLDQPPHDIVFALGQPQPGACW